MRKCSVEGCERKHNAKGFCSLHYSRWKDHGDPLAEVKPHAPRRECSVDGCSNIATGLGYCRQHYARFHATGDPLGVTGSPVIVKPKNKCIVPSCDRDSWARGMCTLHYGQWRKYGDPEHRQRRERGTGHIIPSAGYLLVKCKGHPNASKKGYVRQHILIMSEKIGRGLLPDEEVHHINGIRDDNRIENLELWSTGHPPGQRVEDKIEYFKQFLERYGYSVEKNI